MVQRFKATITGMVQGIGFRPFVYNLAREKKLSGYILNTGTGVDLEVEGDAEKIAQFFAAIENNHLPLAQITSVQKIILPLQNDNDFTIRKSESSREKSVLIVPDICVCDECLQEMQHPNDRRYRYPFTNCTNCGPRYTIIEDIPYDRPNTAMKNFTMCPDCLKEYQNPSNRRFHAQPNACPVCGPQVVLYTADKQLVPVSDPIIKTIDLLRQGHIVAIKGLGGFHLAVNAMNSKSVQRLRERKNREEKPFAMMVRDLTQINSIAHLSNAEQQLLLSPQRPIVLLHKKEPNRIAPGVAPQNINFGVMLPYTPLHYLLFDSDLVALVMTSANISDEPLVIDNEEAFRRLNGIADFILLHDRDIYLRSDDSVVRCLSGRPVQIRRSRGYIPQPIFLKQPIAPILACGAELKNTICLSKGNQAFLSQHIGDLKGWLGYQFFLHTIEHFQRILDIKPQIIAYDLHPDYLSSRFARGQKHLTLVKIQHHHAHIISCLGENHIDEPVIGLAFDGTGLGTDGKIWGGEILLVERADFSRLGHLKYLPLPGGDAAIKEPWRMGLSYLFQAYGENLMHLELPFLKHIDSQKIKLIMEMMKIGLNCPETSSLGRLFDGIAAILGLCYKISFEGQAAIVLEMVSDPSYTDALYSFEWKKVSGIYQIQTEPIIRGVVDDLIMKKSIASISSRFHCTLITLFTQLCIDLCHDYGIKKIALSGGVFQNVILTTGLWQSLEREGFTVITHSKVPPNDGGIALGQALIAHAKTSTL